MRIGKSSGFSLIETMVALVISMIGTLAMMAAFARFEGVKRTTTSGNDAQQAGSYALFELERQIRMAGSGIEQGQNSDFPMWGCALNARMNGAVVLPLPGPLPAPFAAVPATVRALPLLVYAGAGDSPDTIAIVSGNPAVRALGMRIQTTTATNVRMKDGTFGIYANDFLLAAGSTSGAKPDDCSLGVVDAPPAATSRDFNLRMPMTTAAGFQRRDFLYDLGKAPVVQLYGVDTQRNVLVSLDLLRRNGTVPGDVADGVVTIKALYGVDTNDDGVVDEWTSPTGGTWGASALNDGSDASKHSAARIKAVRIALVARSQLDERASDYAGATTLTLFADQPGQSVQVATQAQYRYKTYETTIQISNATMVAIF